ncbi:hypothetical protein [Streptomyces sp. RKAG293]|uniref:hypothetical protein n=1 Tax=Streptomyces sp. RKAG293 TaxID=2893403 RepID=UPI0020331D53|nr:hypothetical protein [Streptomyces sp. RKAG293]MCM2420292.1 hypothetical protein [Streptomyces sp. RKAG293]
MEQQTFTEQAGVKYAAIGKGKRVHYSPSNDDGLCGRAITAYLTVEEAVALFDNGYELCAPCHRAAEKRAEAARLAAGSPLAAAVVALVDTIEQATEPAPIIVRADQVQAGDTVLGGFAEGVTVESAEANHALTHANPYTADPTPFAGAGCCDGCAMLADHRGPVVILATDTPWDVCDPMPAADPVLIRRHAAQPAVDDVQVEEHRTAKGSTPSAAGHPDIAAARAVLAGLAAATMTDHHDVSAPTEDERTVRGYLAEPRGQGRVALYWLEEGRIVRRDDVRHGASLDCLAWSMVRAGWTVEKLLRSSQCVSAHRPGADDAPAAVEPAVVEQPAPAARECLHHIAARADVSGDPITACARKQPNQEAGVFNDEGCVEAYDCAVQAANRAAEANVRDDAPAGDPTYTWDLLCADHRDSGQQVDDCEECNDEDAAANAQAEAGARSVELDDTLDVIEQAERVDGTWRGQWIPAEPTDAYLIALPAEAEQGALFA